MSEPPFCGWCCFLGRYVNKQLHDGRRVEPLIREEVVSRVGGLPV